MIPKYSGKQLIGLEYDVNREDTMLQSTLLEIFYFLSSLKDTWVFVLLCK